MANVVSFGSSFTVKRTECLSLEARRKSNCSWQGFSWSIEGLEEKSPTEDREVSAALERGGAGPGAGCPTGLELGVLESLFPGEEKSRQGDHH